MPKLKSLAKGWLVFALALGITYGVFRSGEQIAPKKAEASAPSHLHQFTFHAGNIYHYQQRNPAGGAAAPTLATQGLNMKGLQGFRVTVCADATFTMTSGTLDAYWYSYEAGLWSRNPGLDLVISVTATSCSGGACRCQTFPDQNVPAAYGGRVLYQAGSAGVVTSGGGNAHTVYIDGWGN